jgi:D-aspartate ligase
VTTNFHIEQPSSARFTHQPPVFALGGGVTLAAVLNILRHTDIPCYALCPETDFVRRSRWYRQLPTALPNPAPADLAALLESLEVESAVLLPCSDDWLRAVAALPAHLAQRFPSCSSPAVDVLTDKWLFAQLLEKHGIPRPETHLITSRRQLDALPESFFDGALLKPLSSVDFASKHGVKGYMVNSLQQASQVIGQLELPIMLQEFVPGPPNAGYFLDGFRDRSGRITAMFARRRLRMHPGKLGNSTFIESVPLRDLHGAIFPLEYLLEQMSYRGIFSAEFKYDSRDRTFKLIEINARPWWYVEFAAHCGVDVCSMAYQDALGLPVDEARGYEIGRRCYFALNDLRGWKQNNVQHKTSLFSLFRTWSKSFSTPFHWNDPMPALAYFGQTVVDFFATPTKAPAPETSVFETSGSTDPGTAPETSSARYAASAK